MRRDGSAKNSQNQQKISSTCQGFPIKFPWLHVENSSLAPN